MSIHHCLLELLQPVFLDMMHEMGLGVFDAMEMMLLGIPFFCDLHYVLRDLVGRHASIIAHALIFIIVLNLPDPPSPLRRQRPLPPWGAPLWTTVTWSLHRMRGRRPLGSVTLMRDPQKSSGRE